MSLLKKQKVTFFFIKKLCKDTSILFLFFFFFKNTNQRIQKQMKKKTHTHTNEKYIKRKRLKKKTKEKEKTKTDGFRKKKIYIYIMATHVHIAHGFLIFFFIGVSPLVFSPFWGKIPANFFSSPPSNQTPTKNILSPLFFHFFSIFPINQRTLKSASQKSTLKHNWAK